MVLKKGGANEQAMRGREVQRGFSIDYLGLLLCIRRFICMASQIFPEKSGIEFDLDSLSLSGSYGYMPTRKTQDGELK